MTRDPFTIHQRVLVLKHAKLAGLVGTVVDVKPAAGSVGGRVQVAVEGVIDGEGIKATAWIAPANLEVA